MRGKRTGARDRNKESKSGYVTWTWKVGTNTTKGYWAVTVHAGKSTVSRKIHVN